MLATSPAHARDLMPDEALAQAAEQSPTLKASMHDLEAAAHSTESAADARDPVYFANADAQYNEQHNATGQGVVRNSTQLLGADTGLRFFTDIGTQLEVGVSTGATWRTTNIDPATTDSVTFGPTYSGEIYLSARQPLLRGAGTDGVLAPLRQAEANQEQTNRRRHNTASQLALDVLNAYWELWYAEQSVAVQEQALTLAERQLEESRLRSDQLGTASRADTLRFASEAAAIRQSLSGVRADRAARAIELGRLLGMGSTEAESLSASAPPPAPERIPPLAALVQEAEMQSTSLAAARAELVSAEVRLASTSDADQPRLDLVARTSAGGVWADDALPGLALPGDRPAFAVLGGIELELPVGGSASHDHAEARSLMSAAQARYEAETDAVEATVATLRERLSASMDQVDLATETAGIAQQLAEAERARLDLGTATPVDVVQAQQTHREAELRVLRSLVDRAASALAIEHHTGRLLGRILPMIEEPS